MPKQIFVKKWIAWDSALENADIGMMGGYVKKGMRWPDYERLLQREHKRYFEALRKEIIKKEIKITGDQHQRLPDGAPLFNDGTVGRFSYRAWGDLMAAIWSTEENKDYEFMDFYQQKHPES